MRAFHRRAAFVLAVGLVFVSGCEPLDNLLGTSGSEEASDEDAAADDPDAAAGTEDATDPEDDGDPEDGEDLNAEEGSVDEPNGSDEDPSPEEPAEDASDDQDTQGSADGAPCTDDDTMLGSDLPAEAEHVQTATGDLTGDGQPDELITYALEAGDGLVFTLRVATASGFIAERELEAAVDVHPVMPLGATAFGGDRDVAFVLEGSGASGFGVSLFALHDWDDEPCALLPVTIPDDSTPRMFPIGGTVGQASGLGCGEADGVPTLTVTRAEQTEDGGYEWMRTAWHWNDRGALEYVGDEQATIADGEDVPDVGGLDCAGIDLP